MFAIAAKEADKTSNFPLVLAALPRQKLRRNTTNGPGGIFMHKLCVIVTAIGVGISSMAWADPLSPGKPAGVHAAQMGDKEWLVFGGIGLVAIGIAIGTSGGAASASASQPITVVTTSATTG
jgi:hypothetical protein